MMMMMTEEERRGFEEMMEEVRMEEYERWIEAMEEDAWADEMFAQHEMEEGYNQMVRDGIGY